MGVIRLRLRMKHQKLVGSIETGLPETLRCCKTVSRICSINWVKWVFRFRISTSITTINWELQQQFAREQTQQQQTNAHHGGTQPDNDPAPETPNPQPRMFGQNGVDVTV
ncbi:MAG: hypothetical protein R3C26_23905 [Calditrichia bacterium]